MVPSTRSACCQTNTRYLLRGTIVNRTYGIDKNLPGINLTIFTNNIWSYQLWSPVIVPGTKTCVTCRTYRAVRARTCIHIGYLVYVARELQCWDRAETLTSVSGRVRTTSPCKVVYIYCSSVSSSEKDKNKIKTFVREI